MRIRSTKPEFWRSNCMDSWPVGERLLARNHLPRTVFSGDVGTVKDWRQLDYLGGFIRWSHTCFIYHLFDQGGEPAYFGKALTPSYRFQKHSSKPWWPEVAHLNLYVVSCESHKDEQCIGFGSNPRSVIERAALLWERKAISDVQPRWNIAHNPAAQECHG